MTTRREAMIGALTAGSIGPVHLASARQEAIEDDADRKSVMAAGMTEAEADCWRKTAEAAGAFFALPELHPLDQAEVVTAVHVIQNKLLSRPTYRKYLEEAKKNHGINRGDGAS